MLAASAITFSGILDAFYFLKIIKAFVKIRKKLKQLKKIDTHEICDLVSLFHDKKPYERLFVSIRGIAKMKGDGNIVSAIVTNDLIQKSTRNKFFFDKIPFKNILKNPTYLRPANLKDVVFGMTDEKFGIEVMIKNLKKADITGALTERKNFDVRLPESKNFFLTLLRTIYDFILGIFPLSMFKEKRKTGQRITYYGFLDKDFITVTGEAFKDEKGRFYFLRPEYVTKQLTFSIKRLQK